MFKKVKEFFWSSYKQNDVIEEIERLESVIVEAKKVDTKDEVYLIDIQNSLIESTQATIDGLSEALNIILDESFPKYKVSKYKDIKNLIDHPLPLSANSKALHITSKEWRKHRPLSTDTFFGEESYSDFINDVAHIKVLHDKVIFAEHRHLSKKFKTLAKKKLTTKIIDYIKDDTNDDVIKYVSNKLETYRSISDIFNIFFIYFYMNTRTIPNKKYVLFLNNLQMIKGFEMRSKISKTLGYSIGEEWLEKIARNCKSPNFITVNVKNY